jgi:hypothetical protein
MANHQSCWRPVVTNPQDTGNAEALAKKLQELDITFAKSDNDLLTVYTNSEPYFCYDSFNEEELHALVIKTIKSYAKFFYGVDEINVLGVNNEPLPKPIVPVERVEAQSKLRPVYNLAA